MVTLLCTEGTALGKWSESYLYGWLALRGNAELVQESRNLVLHREDVSWQLDVLEALQEAFNRCLDVQILQTVPSCKPKEFKGDNGGRERCKSLVDLHPLTRITASETQNSAELDTRGVVIVGGTTEIARRT